MKANLIDIAKLRGEALQKLLMRFAAEGFLYRISRSEHKGKFLLKDAVLFSFWFNEPHRPTKDLDLLGLGKTDIPTFETLACEICRIDGEDGLNFLSESVKGSNICGEEIYASRRLNLLAILEKARIPLQIDVCSGDAVTPQAKEEILPTILDLPASRIIVYLKERVAAEKFDAMIKLGIGNSRMDFWDIAYLIKECEFNDELLQKAIKATFKTRQTPLP